MEKSKIERKPCRICGVVHTEDKLFKLEGKLICHVCLSLETILCSRCGERIWSVDNSGTLIMSKKQYG